MTEEGESDYRVGQAFSWRFESGVSCAGEAGASEGGFSEALVDFWADDDGGWGVVGEGGSAEELGGGHGSPGNEQRVGC